jgi:hypothetical protein
MPRIELLGSSFEYYIVYFQPFLQDLGTYNLIAYTAQLAHPLPTGLLRTLGLSINTPRKRVAWVFNSFEYLMWWETNIEMLLGLQTRVGKQ